MQRRVLPGIHLASVRPRFGFCPTSVWLLLGFLGLLLNFFFNFAVECCVLCIIHRNQHKQQNFKKMVFERIAVESRLFLWFHRKLFKNRTNKSAQISIMCGGFTTFSPMPPQTSQKAVFMKECCLKIAVETGFFPNSTAKNLISPKTTLTPKQPHHQNDFN